MTRVKFANGYVGLLKDNIAAIMEKKGECEIVETGVPQEAAPNGPGLVAPGEDEIEELQRKASRNAPRVPRLNTPRR